MSIGSIFYSSLSIKLIGRIGLITHRPLVFLWLQCFNVLLLEVRKFLHEGILQFFLDFFDLSFHIPLINWHIIGGLTVG